MTPAPTAAILGLGIVGRAMAIVAPPGTIGIDIDPHRVELCREAGGEATLDLGAARGRDLVFLCVGTPMGEGGALDPRQLSRALEEARQVVTPDSVLVIRSTILPHLLPQDFPCAVAVNPEFLRVRRAVREALHPPFLVVGAWTATAFARVLAWWVAAGLDPSTPRLTCTPQDAITLKYACNWFHALKVEFANLVGEVAGKWGADGTRVMEMFVRDTLLNVSPAYLTPRNPFGGACLPKDLYAGIRALEGHAKIGLLEALGAMNVLRGGPAPPTRGVGEGVLYDSPFAPRI